MIFGTLNVATKWQRANNRSALHALRRACRRSSTAEMITIYRMFHFGPKEDACLCA